ncbi:hypothetical protein J4Q44_G00136220 [Coregonus suidteri]|uniref:Uncharacterized protein n=1 Tax=Coregonus suidteri TaxID=861788 RepID=A0AAN8QYZ2_9TELE
MPALLPLFRLHFLLGSPKIGSKLSGGEFGSCEKLINHHKQAGVLGRPVLSSVFQTKARQRLKLTMDLQTVSTLI